MSKIESLKRECEKNGFPLAGVVDLDLAWALFHPHVDRYREWIERGNHGEMHYLQRGLERRTDPRLVYPETKSILCVARPTQRTPLGSKDPTIGPRIARYTAGGDYHDSMKLDLERALMAFNEKQVQASESPLRYKVCVDTSAVLERSWAHLAGLGWIGKNTLLIHPKFGSYLLIGVALLDQTFDAPPAPLPNYCGSCTRCIKGCPTEALSTGGWLDSRKCTAYLTLEKRGEWSTTAPTEKIGTWIAGCDICQEVCPFNIKPEREEQVTSNPTVNPLITWDALFAESTDAYRARVQGSALSRVKPEMARRNLEQAYRNSRGKDPDTTSSESPY